MMIVATIGELPKKKGSQDICILNLLNLNSVVIIEQKKIR